MNLPSSELCCGCSACYAICPNSAITMKMDIEGFLQPTIDETLCIHCSLCEKVCPILHPREERESLVVYASKAKDDDLRMKSSSGGIFSLLAKEIFKQDGIVYGAGWERPVMRVVHKSAENEEELEDLKGSKYVQSDMGDIYQDVKKQLLLRRLVMFTGTPCQIAGLKHFLRKVYERLLCVDVICHAVPSPLIFTKYIKEFEKKFSSKVISISFRNKTYSWRRFSISLKFSNKRTYLCEQSKDLFMKAFLSEMINRKSCHFCPAKSGRSGADITIGDYWGIRNDFPIFEDEKGISLILIQTEKGLSLFKKCLPYLLSQSSTYEKAILSTSALVKSPQGHVDRALILRDIHTKGFTKTIHPYFKASIRERLRSLLSRIYYKVFK